MLGQSAPEFSKDFNLAIVFQAKFEFIRRVDINDYRQSVREDHIQGRVQITNIIGPQCAGIGGTHNRRRLDRKAHMIETHRFDQCDIFCGGVRVEMIF